MGNQQAKFFLPEDIITQILLLLPLHSLLACKCVSKQWRDLIKNPRFVKLYEPQGTALFLYKDNVYSLLISDHEDNKKTKPRHLPIGPFHRGTNWFRSHNLLLESSNKRACVKAAANDDFLVYDLVTGDSNKVAGPLPERSPLHNGLVNGFGYDPYADDFKIVVLALCHHKADDNTPYRGCDQGFVYSFRNGSWKSFKGFADALYHWGRSPLGYGFNGALHWVVEVDVSHVVVAAMDLHSARLDEIALPGPVAFEYKRWFLRPALGELDGHLCCCRRYGPSYSFDVWVMKEYGIKESWTKLLSIGGEHLWRWTSPPVLCSIEGGAKVAICLSHHSCMWRLFEYDLCEDTIRVMHDC